ncbi:MAG: hypothetical protein M3P44_16335 [Actinomycetota bacterium]|nr:hypothetical protein [Actinomycetota bacterium]
MTKPAPHLVGINELPRGALQGLAGVDREGMPPVADLAALEEQSRHRFSPRRRVWGELSGFDDRVAELDRRQQAVSKVLGELYDSRSSAPVKDAERLAAWLVDEKGPRPEPTGPAIDAEIAERQADLEALTLATGTVLRAKAEFVTRHRERLVREADRQTTAAHKRVLALIEGLAAAREDLAELRDAAVWAATFPAEAASRPPMRSLIAGGLQRPLKAAGIPGQTQTDVILTLLREDADWLASSCSVEQRELISGQATTTNGATWGGSAEAVAQERAEKREALEAYKREWGSYPA